MELEEKMRLLVDGTAHLEQNVSRLMGRVHAQEIVLRALFMDASPATKSELKLLLIAHWIKAKKHDEHFGEGVKEQAESFIGSMS